MGLEQVNKSVLSSAASAITVTGINSETYTVYIGSTPYAYIAPLGSNADTVGDEIAQKIDAYTAETAELLDSLRSFEVF